MWFLNCPSVSKNTSAGIVVLYTNWKRQNLDWLLKIEGKCGCVCERKAGLFSSDLWYFDILFSDKQRPRDDDDDERAEREM